MAQYHIGPEPIRFSTSVKDSRVMFSANANRTALVFVHGFGGAATATWGEFPSLIREDVRFSGYDVIFYGYDGLYSSVDASGILFFEFLDQLFAKPLDIIPTRLRSHLGRPRTFAYDHVVIVAHSLGAVVSRRALLTAEQGARAWTANCHLVLFAPAHNGSPAPEQLTQSLSALPKLFQLIGFYKAHKMPPLTDLKLKSVTLKNLRKDSEAAFAKARQADPAGKVPHVVAERVVWADNDTIVVNTRFVEDPPIPAVFLGRNHIDMCKPTKTFPNPLIELKHALDAIGC